MPLTLPLAGEIAAPGDGKDHEERDAFDPRHSIDQPEGRYEQDNPFGQRRGPMVAAFARGLLGLELYWARRLLATTSTSPHLRKATAGPVDGTCLVLHHKADERLRRLS